MWDLSSRTRDQTRVPCIAILYCNCILQYCPLYCNIVLHCIFSTTVPPGKLQNAFSREKVSLGARCKKWEVQFLRHTSWDCWKVPNWAMNSMTCWLLDTMWNLTWLSDYHKLKCWMWGQRFMSPQILFHVTLLKSPLYLLLPSKC